ADPGASPDGWCWAFRHPMTLHAFAGGHFHLFDRVEEVADRIDTELGRLRPGGPGPGAPSGARCAVRRRWDRPAGGLSGRMPGPLSKARPLHSGWTSTKFGREQFQ
ncbi:hypothetical protein ACFW1M_33810, partial [Streptomyces inhibens]